MTVQAAVYCRISDDRTGEGLGVARQRKDCESLIEREGWKLTRVYTDNDLSAYSGKARPEYERMLSDLHLGEIEAIVAWHPDRLYRSMRDMEDFIDAVENAHAQVRTVTAGTVDLGTASGRMTARVGAAVARHESEHKAERIRRKMRELAEAGRSSGGPRSFGYEPSHYTVRETEAVLIREAAARALAGESLRAIARDWNQREIPTARAATHGWSYQSIRAMLLSPRIAGLRSHRGEIVGEAQWPAILDRSLHEQLKSTLRPREGPRSRVRKRLLTGLIFCGACGYRLYSKNRTDGAPLYACVKDPGRGEGSACGRLAVVSKAADVEIGAQVLAALSGRGLAEALAAANDDEPGVAHLVAGLAADEARLEQLALDFADGELTRREWRAVRDRLVGRIEDAQVRLACHHRPSPLAALTTGNGELEERWQKGDITWRRAVVEAVIARVDVAPKGHHGGNRFDPGRLSVTWLA